SPPRISKDSGALFQTRQEFLEKPRRGAPLPPVRHTSHCRRRRPRVLSVVFGGLLASETPSGPQSRAVGVTRECYAGLAFPGLFLRFAKFLMQTAQFRATRRQSETAGSPSVRVTAQAAETDAKTVV